MATAETCPSRDAAPISERRRRGAFARSLAGALSSWNHPRPQRFDEWFFVALRAWILLSVGLVAAVLAFLVDVASSFAGMLLNLFELAELLTVRRLSLAPADCAPPRETWRRVPEAYSSAPG